MGDLGVCFLSERSRYTDATNMCDRSLSKVSREWGMQACVRAARGWRARRQNSRDARVVYVCAFSISINTTKEPARSTRHTRVNTPRDSTSLKQRRSHHPIYAAFRRYTYDASRLRHILTIGSIIHTPLRRRALAGFIAGALDWPRRELGLGGWLALRLLAAKGRSPPALEVHWRRDELLRRLALLRDFLL